MPPPAPLQPPLPNARSPRAAAPVSSLSIALTDSGGAGVMTAGQMLLEAAAHAGYFGLMARSLGPQIRGGESAALLRLAVQPVQSPDDAYDILLALDWGNIDRFIAELPLHPGSIILHDPTQGEIPAALMASGATPIALPLQDLTRAVPSGRANSIALGVCAGLCGIAPSSLHHAITRVMGGKGDAALTASLAAAAAGAAWASSSPALEKTAPLAPLSATANAPRPATRWSLTGNEAVGLGALRGGIRFVAAYPITPATEVLEWLAPALSAHGGTLVQAEDELASITMCLGASFGGVPALTATSGPGLALMTEALGLAVASETPVVVVDVMRGGPSTGIPTKSEQSDLNIAVYGLHGDAPHIVTAPTGLLDCIPTTEWSVHLAEYLQVPVIVLSDQAQGQTRAIVPPPPPSSPPLRRKTPAGEASASYQRYALTEDGISPMATPGMPGCAYVADGLEHNTRGTPSTQARHHQEQLDKRLHKLTNHVFGPRWADVETFGDGAPETAVLTFGSVTQPVREALRRWADIPQARPIRLIAVRLLSPAQPAAMAAALAGIHHALVVEQTHGGQFLSLLRAHYTLPDRTQTLHRPGPLPIRPGEILAALSAP